MKDPRLPAGPETAWYRERLYKERRNARPLGLAILGIGVVLLLVALVLAIAHSWGNFLLFLLLAFLPILQGLSLLRASWTPVTAERVARLRSEERAQLFQQAQGIHLPWQYRDWARVLEMLLGLFFLLEGGQALFYVFDTSSGVAAGLFIWVGILAFVLLGLFLIVDGLYLRPGKARRFIERSSAELAYRLSMGEHLLEKQPEKRRE
ncbi:MAG TPA: hypothetical protein VFN35_35030 [Ktedonobacteraceae bacterium]|nr:hypothetical protein [Ktedonobacteraceae bacterium]